MDDEALNIFDNPGWNVYRQMIDGAGLYCGITDQNFIVQWLSKNAEEIFTPSLLNSNLFSFFDIPQTNIDDKKSFVLNEYEYDLSIMRFNDEKSFDGYFLTFSNKKSSANSLHNLAHDLNNILTGILNSIELLKQQSPLKDKQASLINNIENSSIRAAEILEDTLNKNSSSNKRRINLQSIIADVVSIVKSALSKNITITHNISSDIKPMLGKTNDIYRIIMNLIVNSKESIKEKGSITVTAHNITESEKDIIPYELKENEYIYLSIKDTGEGIPEENLTKIFSDKFSTKKKKVKSGLGLNIVKDIVTKHNGIIKVDSNIGEGTEFRILFPALKKKTHIKADGKKTILIAEDENNLRELLTELLRSYNYNIIEAVNGNELISKFNTSDNINMIIIDRKMPGINGLDCIKHIRNENTSIPIILASGSPTEEGDKIVTQLNIDKVINKPYDFEYLLSSIEKLIG